MIMIPEDQNVFNPANSSVSAAKSLPDQGK